MEYQRTLELVENLIHLENKVSGIGARKAVADLKTLEMETPYDTIFDLEAAILKECNLPLTIYYRSYLFQLTNSTFERVSFKKELILWRLKQAAQMLEAQN
jgi:hypothetical protein